MRLHAKFIKSIGIFLLFLSLFPDLSAQSRGLVPYTLVWRDAFSGTSIPYATVLIRDSVSTSGYRCDGEGRVSVDLHPCHLYEIVATSVGYKRDTLRLTTPPAPGDIVCTLIPNVHELNEVRVTAKESKGMSSASIIDKNAMRHLQPSSFADVLQLLPGGRSRDPYLVGPNAMHLREVPVGDRNYATTSLGVAFMIDGMPVRENANLQKVRGTAGRLFLKRGFLNKGVDMRTISTDNIKSIEIIRGIPSVKYGNLTSGLVKINRRRDMEDVEGRFKADMSSRLYYIGGGTNQLGKDFNLSAGLDLLNAMSDPRNIRENYKRITGSVRGTKNFYFGNATLSWMTNADITISIDDEKEDKDLNRSVIDSYRSSYSRYALGSNLEYLNPSFPWLTSLSWESSVSLLRDRIDIVKYVELSEVGFVSNTMVPGEHDGVYLTEAYRADYAVDGKPRYFTTKLTGESILKLGKLSNELVWGTEWMYDVNKGQGEVFDIMKPLTAGLSVRPINFHDIPATNNLSFFAETNSTLPIGRHSFTVQAGVRTLSLLHLDPDLSMSGRTYYDPRVNLKWKFPDIMLMRKPLQIALYGGVGWASMAPTLEQLYPLVNYYDLIELNYFHAKPELRRLYLKTFVEHSDNHALQPARNLKKEIRLDAEWNGYSLSTTYFVEDLMSGFRPTSSLAFLTYRKFDTSGLNHQTLTAPPDILTLPFKEKTYIAFNPNTTNGSRTYKEGVEFMAYTPRYTSIYTRFTLSGGWFRTTYRNSLAQYYRPGVILGGEEYQYVGVYKDLEGNTYEMLNTDLRADTHIPSLGLGVSLSIMSEWFMKAIDLPISPHPDYYINKELKQVPYTEADAEDTYLRWLTRSSIVIPDRMVPMESNLNIKATKYLFDRKLQVAMFVNRIINYAPEYTSHETVIRRRKSPYFGMELNVRF